MSAYGLSIAPKWYKTEVSVQYTRLGFVRALYQALLTAGMEPIRSLNPAGINLESTATADPTVSGDRDDLIWWLQYPTTDTFIVGGVAYRPIIGLSCHIRETAGSESTVNMSNSVAIQQGIRPANSLLRTDIITDGTVRTVANYGFGSYSVQPDSTMTAPMAGLKGSFVGLAYWKNFDGSANATRTALLPVANLHVMLGPTGLVVQAGNGVDKTDSQNILNFAAVFAGTRLPGRGRIPAQDANLNLINPVLWLSLNTTTTTGGAGQELSIVQGLTLDYTSYDTYYRPAARILGMQHELKTTTSMVLAQIFNLENLERPLFPLACNRTLGSPRAASPSPAHIMNRIVYVPWWRYAATSDFYSPVNSEVRTQPSPEWADVWSAEGLRLCDGTAPMGEITDPNTSDTWYLSWAATLATMFAFKTTGMTKYGIPAWTGMSVTTDDAYDMSSAGFSSVFPQSTAWTPSGTGQLYPQSAQDAMQTNALTTGTGYVTMVVTGYPSDAAQYLLSCDLMNKGTSAAAANAANLTISTSIDDGSTWQVVFTAQNAGNNSGAAYYTATATGNIPIAKSANGKIYVRFDVLYSTTVGTRTSAVSNIHIKKAT